MTIKYFFVKLTETHGELEFNQAFLVAAPSVEAADDIINNVMTSFRGTSLPPIEGEDCFDYGETWATVDSVKEISETTAQELSDLNLLAMWK